MKAVLFVLALAACSQLSYAGCPDSKGFADCSGDKDPCALVRCKAGTVCRVDNCGGCQASCEEEGMMHILTVGDEQQPPPRLNSKPGACPDGSSPVQCLADPCRTSNRCNATTEVCESNYCGGCNAVCKPKPANSRPNTTATSPKPNSGKPNAAGQCPDGSLIVRCLVDPCANNGPCNKSQTCKSNYCGGCNAVCVNHTANNVPPVQQPKPNTKPVPADSPCPPGVPLVRCFADPCQVSNPCNPQTETCESNYCGGCNAVCRTNGKKNVPEPVEDKPPANSSCQFAPCIATTCIANSICKNDWEKCTGVCIPLEPSSNSSPNSKQCGGVAPCAATLCAVNNVCINDWKSCTGRCVKQCTRGYGYNAKSNSCKMCKPGHVTDVQKNVCVACASGTYFKFDLSGRRCLPCPKGMSTKGKTGQLKCVADK